MIPAVAYARFSSDNQRDESIDAQVRAIRYYAQNFGYDIIKVYADKAKTGRNADRVNFQKMIADSSSGLFKAVIVHKLDRFSRGSFDTLKYEKELNRNDVDLISVNEKLENTPSGLLTKQIILGMNQFYSANLSFETMKGLKENAYNCKHTGGTPPLGYDVDPQTKKLVINYREAEAVSVIFDMFINGSGYGTIINFLNQKGYTTKKGSQFGKNSLHEILKNEKYTGKLIFNRRSSKNTDGKINTKIKNLSRAIANETDVPEMHEMINDFSSQKNALKIQQYELETVPQANEKTFKEIKELFILNTDLKKLPPESQKLVIQKLISRIYLYPPKGDGYKYRAKIIIAPYNKDSLTDLFDYVGDNLDSMVEVTGFEP